MNKSILSNRVQEFIGFYADAISKLAFSGSPFSNISVQELIQQIESRRKIAKKLPSWYNKSGIYYPPKANLEQTSSEVTAKYKASLVKGKTLADLTGGFGVDTFYFSKKFNKVYHFEHNSQLSEITAHNFQILGIKNVLCIAGNGITEINQETYDVIYVDPSRRHSIKGKVYYLADCEPNIPEHQSSLLNSCHTLIIKSSPMLDITAGLRELDNVAQIHIVAVDNEVKELLWLCSKDHQESPTILTINIRKNNAESFNFQLGKIPATTFSLPRRFLYEPNAAIMKSGGFNHMSEKYELDKLHQHSHLFTSDSLIDFPGRCFHIKAVIPYSKASMRKILPIAKANIATRNFPESVSKLREKWKISDGGDQYLFFTTNLNGEKVVLRCIKAD